MLGPYLLGRGERCDRARDPGDPRPSASRQRQPVDGPREQLIRVTGAAQTEILALLA